MVESLSADQALTLMVGPSLTLALRDAWVTDSTHGALWGLAHAIASETASSQAAYLAAPMVAAPTPHAALVDFSQRTDRVVVTSADLQKRSGLVWLGFGVIYCPRAEAVRWNKTSAASLRLSRPRPNTAGECTSVNWIDPVALT